MTYKLVSYGMKSEREKCGKKGKTKWVQGAATPSEISGPCGPIKIQDKAATCQTFLHYI